MLKKGVKILIGAFALLVVVFVGWGFITSSGGVPQEMLDMCNGVVLDIKNVAIDSPIRSECQDPKIQLTVTNLGDIILTQEKLDNSGYYFMFCRQGECVTTDKWYKVVLEAPIAPNQEGVITLVKQKNKPNGFGAFKGYTGEVSLSFDYELQDGSTAQCVLSPQVVQIEVAPSVGSPEDLKRCFGN